MYKNRDRAKSADHNMITTETMENNIENLMK